MNGYTNGSAHHVAPARVSERDPFEGVLGIGQETGWIIAAAIGGAIALHGAAAARTAMIDPVLLAWSSRTGDEIERRLNAAIDVSFNKEAPPPPPPVDEPKEEEKPVEKTLEPVAKEQNPYEDVKPDQAPKPAAEAGQILAANPTNEPLDFTGNTFVVGSGEQYAGGSTTSAGTSKKAARTSGNGNGTSETAIGTQQAVQTGPDRSRGIALAGSSDWKCPWPHEADAEDINESYATIEVSVGADGRIQSAKITSDPGFGFGREAKQCAMRQSYNAALDHDGRPIASTKKFRVRFER